MYKAVIAGVAGVSAALVLSFYAGYKYSNAGWEKEQAERSAQFAEQVKQINEENTLAINKALSERDNALAALADSRKQSARLQQSASDLSKQLGKLSATRSTSGDGDSVKLGRCESLLAEASDLLGTGVSLAQEGAELSGRINADKDVLITSYKNGFRDGE